MAIRSGQSGIPKNVRPPRANTGEAVAPAAYPLQELNEALRQQTAVSAVLRVMASAPEGLKAIPGTIVENAVKLAGATQGHIRQRDGDVLRLAAHYGVPPEQVAFLTATPLELADDDSPGVRSMREKKVIHVLDAQVVRRPDARAPRVGARTMLVVPLIRDGTAFGFMNVWRSFVEPFTERQIELVKTFADQAVIAIENVRLFNETRASLEQQTATAEILKLISSSPGNIQPVLDAVASIGARLCEAQDAIIQQREGDVLRFVAHHGALPNRPVGDTRSISPDLVTGRSVLEGRQIHVHDLQSATKEYPLGSELAREYNYRTILATPLIREGVVIGSIMIRRVEARPFAPGQLALMRTFADQAVIAIENVRLFNEIQEKSRELESANKQISAQTGELRAWNANLEQRVRDQVSELERFSRLKRFLSPKIGDLILSGDVDDPLKTHRREITVVFTDLRGFTAFTETAEPEEVMGVLRDYHAVLGRIMMAHDGTLVHFAGDGVMIIFNDPVPVTEPELAAVRMAIEMGEAVAKLSADWKKHGHELGFGVGIANGYATIGSIGFQDRRDYSAIGSVCNLSARLCAEAQAGQILVSQRACARIEDRVVAEPMGELMLKGFHRSVVAFSVTAFKHGLPSAAALPPSSI